MAGLNGLLGIARDALMAQAYGLGVTSQNVSNANTPGYARRQALLETWGTRPPAQGSVHIAGTRRVVDRIVDRRLNEAVGFAFSSSERNEALERIESLFLDAGGTGLGSSVQALFSSFTALSASPADMTVRGQVLAGADELARRVRQTADGILSAQQDMLGKARTVAGEVTDLAAKIASLNKEIAAAEATGEPALDLRDQQESLARELSQRIDVSSFYDKSGAMVILSAGVALVEGSHAARLSVTTTATGGMAVTVQRSGGAEVDVTSKLEGGTLAGLKQARDVDAAAALEKLDQLAYDLATAVNQQFEAGYGLDGQTGRVLFTVTAPPGTAAALSLSAVMNGHPERVAAASSVTSIPGGSDNAVALAQLANAAICTGGTRTPAEAYSDLAGHVATTKAAAGRDAEVRGAMQDQINSMRESVSGVSLDEEMVSLSTFQRAYEAAGKILQTVDQLLAELISKV